MSSSLIPNGPGEPGLRWGLSRHARRLLTLALAGMLIAMLAGRPEFAGAAAPALLLLAAGRGRHPAGARVRAGLSASRVVEGELVAIDAELQADGLEDYSVRWTLHPGPEIEPAGAATAAGARGYVRADQGGKMGSTREKGL